MKNIKLYHSGNGFLKFEGCVNHQGFKEGYCKEFLGRRFLIACGNFKNDKKQGVHRTFFMQGQLKNEGVFENNAKQGWHQFFYVNGKIRERCNYHNDEKIGNCINYDNTGKRIK